MLLQCWCNPCIILRSALYLAKGSGCMLVLLRTRARLREPETRPTSASLRRLCVLCFPGISTTSTPWMTGARPSVGCRCRSCSSWSCRYCLCVYFGPNIYVSSSPIISSAPAAPLPVCLISATGHSRREAVA